MWYRDASMKALKIVVLWLLLSVIPLQGMAVNVVMACNAARQLDVLADARADDMQKLHDMHQHGGIHHAGAGTAPVGAEMPGDACKPDHANAGGGSCAAFCPLALWMPVGDVLLPILANTSTRISYIAFHVPFVVPDGPEHRPRILSL
ncbi:MAG TPA: hypothetical protein VGE12_17600 [Noviherbaspirillum sp.]